MPSEKRQLGDLGESEAEVFLINSGYKILGRNYRIKNIGEIDLIAEKNKKIVFVEVKTRNSTYESNFPLQLSINQRKRRILRRICELYLLENKEHQSKAWQLDGVFINGDFEAGQKERIEHLENILWERYY